MKSNKNTYKSFMMIFTIIMIDIAIWAETDVFVPSMPDIIKYYKISEYKIQQMLSINFFGLFISALFAGPISDFHGRKKIIILGMIVFTLSSLGCAMSSNYNSLLFFRFIQGLGAGIPMVLAWVIIIDIYGEEESASISGWISSSTTGVMAGAPIVGNIINNIFSWQGNFYLIFIVSSLALLMTFIFLDESHSLDKRVKISFKQMVLNYFELSKRSKFIGNVLIVSLSYSCIMIYISNISIIFINHLNIDHNIFSYLQASTMIVYMAGSLISSKMIKKYGMKNTNYIGGIMIIFGATILFLTSVLLEKNIYMICLFMNIYAAGVAISINIVAVDAMKFVDNLKGTAASFFTFTRLAIISFFIQFTSLVFDGTIKPVSIITFVTSLVMITIYFTINKSLIRNNENS